MQPTDGFGHRLDELLEREWLVPNHLGGYASSTLAGLNTRKYHGLLVAAMTPPVRRLVLLSRVEEVVTCNGWPTPLACNEYPGTVHPRGHESLAAFSHEPFPRWAYQGEGWSIEKSLQVLRGENTVVLSYTLIGANKPVTLELRPLFALRPIHDLMYQWTGQLDAQPTADARHHRIPPTRRTPEVFFAHDGTYENASTWYFNTIYRREQDRGYAGLEDVWSPGMINWTLVPGETVHFVCSADPINFDRVIAETLRETLQLDTPIVEAPVKDTDHDLLVRAAEQFVVDLTDEQKLSTLPLVTRFPWSAPSMRDALISLPGLLLVTGKFQHAKALLQFAASKLHCGLLPTEFPETASEPTYHGADTSLWFIHAVWQYFRYTSDESTTRKLLDAATQIIESYRTGTQLGIQADLFGLLVTRSPGRGTTWMDAKAGDWVITPRTGRPVEINALWYNAVAIVAELSRRFGQPTSAAELDVLAAKISRAFNARFWNESARCCFDVVDDHGADASIRPNQLLAVSLPFPVLAVDRHIPVIEKVRRELMTPFGPRTLSPQDPAYVGHYHGDVVSRDRALHQGCVHPWLLGQFVTAQTRAFGRGKASINESRKLLRANLDHLRRIGHGQLGELYDGEAPHRAGGAIACATTAAELLRCYVEDILDQQPGHEVAGRPQVMITVGKIPSKT